MSATKVRTTKCEVVAYGGWPNCVRLSNGRLELVATTDVGPRIVRFGYEGGPNLLAEFPEQAGLTGGDTWRIYGGHRLWHAPEHPVRTYMPDNAPVAWRYEDDWLTLEQPREPMTDIVKSIRVRLGAESDRVTVVHELINEGPWAVKLASWAVTALAPGGTAILPQEHFESHENALLPSRPLVLWPYTNMADPRLTFGERCIQIRQDPRATGQLKIGATNSRRAAAYVLGDTVLLVRAGVALDDSPQASTPLSPSDFADMGCNFEFFTNARMMEVETLGKLVVIEPGGLTGHIEQWELRRIPDALAQVLEDPDDLFDNGVLS